ncbi:MAG: T9SS type A sorting domain-containing protein [Flavobacterium sp.]|nr:T9SS type A sorting domain-containing protein [Flavobacterium sp.]
MLDWYIGKYVPNSNFTYTIGNGTNQIIVNTNTSIFYDSLSWDFGDGTISSSLLPTHSYVTDGTYTIKLTTNKCYLGQPTHVSILEKTVTFCSHTNSVFPNDLLICPNDTATLYTQTADSYQWLDFFGNPIPGEINQSLTTGPGEYSVITTINGCSEQSEPVFIDSYVPIGNEPCNLGIDDHENQNEIILYPNPAENILTIETVNSIDKITVFDILGNKIMPKRVSNSSIDVSSLANGIYFLEISSNNRNIVKKIIKK